MRFVRFGPLKPVKQKGYSIDADDDACTHVPPCRKGFYAFPYGCVEMFIVPKRRRDYRYVLDESGERISYARFLSEWGGNWHRLRKYVHQVAGFRAEYEFMLPKPQFVYVMRDVHHPPRLIKGGKLDQHIRPLLDSDGDKIKAEYFFERRFWNKDDYIFPYESASLDDVDIEALVYYVPSAMTKEELKSNLCELERAYRKRVDSSFSGKANGRYDLSTIKKSDFYEQFTLKLLNRWLKDRGVDDLRQLCVWPVFEGGLEHQQVLMYEARNQHLFEYKGCLWHHLGDQCRPGEVLKRHGNSWVYTDMKAFEHAIKKRYGRYAWLRIEHGRNIENPKNKMLRSFTADDMLEVVIEERAEKGCEVGVKRRYAGKFDEGETYVQDNF